MKIRDLRGILPHADGWSQGSRLITRYVTAHYNGPEIAQNRSLDAWIDHLRFIAEFHMGPYLGGDTIEYHYAILPDGTICQCRQETDITWHCNNTTGNNEAISVHFPIGGVQKPTTAAWSAFTELSDHLIAKYKMSGRRAVYGHRQWPDDSTALPVPHIEWQRGQGPCPGNAIMALLEEWIAGTERQHYRVLANIHDGFAAVRQGPGRWYPIAWNGHCKLPAGHEIEADQVVTGELIGNSALWVHWPAGGFVHISCFEGGSHVRGSRAAAIGNHSAVEQHEQPG
jgi:hypothetical protein